MFAVLKTGGKQYKVASGDVLRVEKLAANAGDKVQFNEILMFGDKIGAPMVDGAAVQAEVIEQIKGDKVIHFVRRRRKHSSKRTKGHRQQLTLLRVTELLASGADKSGVMAAVGAGSVSASAMVAAAPAAKKAPARKAEAKETKKAETKKAVGGGSAPEAATKPAKAKTKPAAEAAGDDLKLLSGVGPALEKKLHEAGVTSFAQIAGWSETDVAEMGEILSFKGRIEREGWIEQARELAKGGKE